MSQPPSASESLHADNNAPAHPAALIVFGAVLVAFGVWLVSRETSAAVVIGWGLGAIGGVFTQAGVIAWAIEHALLRRDYFERT